MRRLLLALSLLTFAAACGDDPVSTSTTAGTYTLMTFNGQQVPTTFEEGQITSGSIVLGADQSFTFSETLTFTEGSETQTVHGTWSLSGSTITFHPTDAEQNTDAHGTISGGTLTISDIETDVRVYNKQ